MYVYNNYYPFVNIFKQIPTLYPVSYCDPFSCEKVSESQKTRFVHVADGFSRRIDSNNYVNFRKGGFSMRNFIHHIRGLFTFFPISKELSVFFIRFEVLLKFVSSYPMFG